MLSACNLVHEIVWRTVGSSCTLQVEEPMLNAWVADNDEVGWPQFELHE